MIIKSSGLLQEGQQGAGLDKITIALAENQTSSGHIGAGKLKFNSFEIERWGLVSDVLNQNYYTNILGRFSTGIGVSPTAPSAISDILAN